MELIPVDLSQLSGCSENGTLRTPSLDFGALWSDSLKDGSLESSSADCTTQGTIKLAVLDPGMLSVDLSSLWASIPLDLDAFLAWNIFVGISKLSPLDDDAPLVDCPLPMTGDCVLLTEGFFS